MVRLCSAVYQVYSLIWQLRTDNQGSCVKVVFGSTRQCGYSMRESNSLLKQLSSNWRVIVLLLSLLLPLESRLQLKTQFLPEISQRSFWAPLQVAFSRENISFRQQLVLFQINHPNSVYIIQEYNRSNISLISEVSVLEYKTDILKLKIGRDYIHSGPSTINSTLFSSLSPSFDHIGFKMFRFLGFEYEYQLLRLDNRENEYGSFHRWLYYRRLSYDTGHGVNVGLKEAVLATGIKRGVDFYYLTPGAIFELEQLHNRVGAIENARTNNDNHIIGFDLEINFRKWGSLYFDGIIDEFQLDAADRQDVQDVFGINLGVKKTLPHGSLVVEYFLASPWLYTNGGHFTNVEYYNYPIGLRTPQSHGLSLIHAFGGKRWNSEIQLSLYQQGEQNLNTVWDADGNKIPLYDYSDEVEVEVDAKIDLKGYRYLDHVRICYNLLDQDDLFFMVGFKLINIINE
jgi:hypothetical protein